MSRGLRALVAIAAALVLPACAGTAARSLRGTPDAAAARLDPASVALDARLLRMADRREPDTVLIDSVLALAVGTPESARRRARVALLIGQLQLAPRYGALRSLLRDPDSLVAANAAFALGLARDTTAVAVLTPLLPGMPGSDERAGVASEAAWALGRIGEPARTAIIGALRRGTAASAQGATGGAGATGAEPLVALLVAASGLRPVPVEELLPFLEHPQADVAVAAAYAVARPRAAGGVRALLTQYTHPEPRVRQQVALAAAYNATGDSLASLASSVLDTLLRDPAADVRVQAIRAFASQAERRPDLGRATEVARLGAADPVAAVRVTTAEQSGVLRPADSSVWRAAWEQDTTFMVQRALLAQAVPLGLLPEALAAWQQDPDPWRRVAALELGNASGPGAPRDAGATGAGRFAAAAWQRASWARGDRAERVRVAGLSLLARVDDPAAGDTLRRYLDDSATQVRAAALAALVRRATATDAQLALELYRRDTTPPTLPERQAALRVIAGAWQRDSLAFDPRLQAQLRALPVSADPRSRGSVGRVTPMSVWSTASPAVRPLREYQSLVTQWNVTLPPVVRPRAIVHTTRGNIELELLAHDAPLTVDNFVSLARRGWFRNSRFHRVIPNFVAQDGDPTGTGSGGPGTTVRDELNRHRYQRGAVGMALSGPDTGGSQYFFTLAAQPHLDGGYTVFAQVVGGLEVMDALLLGDRILDVSVP